MRFIGRALTTFLSYFFVLLALSSCATQKKYHQTVVSWLGAQSDQLIMVWGYPDRTVKLKNNKKMYIYKTREIGENPVLITPGIATVYQGHAGTVVSYGWPQVSGGGSYDKQCKTWFVIGSHQRVIYVHYVGNNCVATSNFRKKQSRPS